MLLGECGSLDTEESEKSSCRDFLECTAWSTCRRPALEKGLVELSGRKSKNAAAFPENRFLGDGRIPPFSSFLSTTDARRFNVPKIGTYSGATGSNFFVICVVRIVAYCPNRSGSCECACACFSLWSRSNRCMRSCASFFFLCSCSIARCCSTDCFTSLS